MSDSPESIVRRFLACWAEGDPDELAGFLSDDAVWVDGPQGVRHGAKEFVDVLAAQLAISRGQSPKIATLLAGGGTVMVEWHGGWTMNDKWIATTVMAVFEIEDGRIKQMREAYDLKSVRDQMKDAGFDFSSARSQ